MRALLALEEAVLHGEQLLAAVRRRPHDDENALPILLQADVEVDAVGPDFDVLLATQVASPPLVILLTPGLLEAHDRVGRQAARLRSEEGLECFAEVPGRGALEVEEGDELVERFRTAQIAWQDLRFEADRLALGCPIADSRSADFERAGSGQHRPLRLVAVANDASQAVLATETLVLGDEGLDLGFEGGLKNAACAILNDLVEWRSCGKSEHLLALIVSACRLVHGVSFRLFGRLLVVRFQRGYATSMSGSPSPRFDNIPLGCDVHLM